MAVIGGLLATQVKRSSSFAAPKIIKKRKKKFSSYSSLRKVANGLKEDLSRNVGYLSRSGCKKLPDIVSVNLLNDVAFRSGRIDTAKACRRNFCGKLLRKDACIKAAPSNGTCLSLQHRHFLDAIDSCGKNGNGDFVGEVRNSRTWKEDRNVEECSPMAVQSPVSEISECDNVAYQGRVVCRKYVNSLPVLFIPSVHSAMKFQFVKPLESSAVAEVFVVQPLRKAFDQLFDVLHENSQTNEQHITVVNRWTSIRTELTQHLTRSLMRKMRRSTVIHNSFACYTVLMRTIQTFPLTDGMPFSFASLERTTDELNEFLKSSDSGCKDNLSVINMVLRLIFMVGCLENELLNCKLWSKSQVSLSCISSWLSAEGKFTFVKRIIQVFVDFLKYRESFVNNLVLATEAQGSEYHFNGIVVRMVSELSPLLQRLILMSQSVSAYPAQTADRIATELAAEYSQMTQLSHRYEFIESMAAPLIKLKLCQRVLERQYPSVVRARVCRSLTTLTLDYLLSTYMSAGSKSEPTRELDSDFVPCCVDGRLLPLERDMCEEFSVLLFTVVLTYVQVKKEDYVDCPLWDQTIRKNESSLSAVDIATLKNLPGQVEKLRRHLEEGVGRNARLTRKTLVFLQKLACLADIC